MYRVCAVAILVFGLLQISDGYCCFRDPLMLTPKCGCTDYDTCGVVKCEKTCANTPKACGCSQPVCSNTGSNICSCGQPTYIKSSRCDCSQPSNVCDCGIPACSCYRDTSNVCYVCDQPSPMCSCMKAAGDRGCKCDNVKSIIYYPEVEYPVTIIEMKPYYYGGCYTY